MERTTALARAARQAEPDGGFRDLVQIALDVAGSLDAREVIGRILSRALDTLRADRATLSSLIDDEIVIEASIGRPGDVTWVGRHYSVDYFAGQPLVREALERLEPVYGGQLEVAAAAPEFREALARVKSVAVVPLVHGGRAVGLLVLSRFGDEPFADPDRATLTLIGAISGLALRNARLYEEVEAARERADANADRLQVAVDAAEEVARETELDKVLIRLLQGATAAVDADGASVARLEGTELVVESTITGEGVGTRWPISPKVLAGIARGRPVQLTAAEYTETPEGLEPIVQPFRRFLVAPLIVRGETIGLLAMGRINDEPFEAAAVQSLQQYSTLGALLLRNARLRAQAQDAERAKSEFMSSAVHELRAPLTVTGGYIAMALEGGFGDLTPGVKNVLEIAQRKTEEAKRLADDLLAVARMEGGVLKPKAERVPVDTAVSEALSRARPRADLVHATLTAGVDSGADALADPALVAKILDNLLNNALIYVEDSPAITVTARREGDQVAITVRDNGIGIASEDQTRIFGRFARGTDRRVLEKPGTGLGLYLSRGLALRMGGSLRLETSAPGRGSTFVLRLPGAA